MGLVRTSKEIARHILYSVGFRRREGHLAPASRADRFARIYSDGVWSFGRADIPLSGTGSSVQATENLRHLLPAAVRRLQAKTVIDVGCGDFTWMSEVELDCDYLGIDIVPFVVQRNSRQFGSPRRRFIVSDVVTTPVPAGDMVLCREVLFHLSLEDGVHALRNMLASGCSYLLLTTDRVTSFNAQINSGDFRLINLERRPYGLPEPFEKIDDSANSKGRFIGLWRAEDVREALA